MDRSFLRTCFEVTMRSLFTLIFIAILGLTSQAWADAPPRVAPELVAPPMAAPADKPAGGLQLGSAAQLRCKACDHLRVAGWGLFAAGYGLQLVGFGAAEVSLWTDKRSDPGLDSLKPIIAVLILPAAIPVVGPILMVLVAYDGHLPQSLFQTPLGWAALASSSAQLLGLAGAVLAERLDNEFQRTHRLALVPLVQPGATGLAVGGTF